MSGDANGLSINLEASVDPDFVGDVGVPASSALLAFTNAVERGDGQNIDEVATTRAALAGEIGDDATLEAAAIIAIFNGLVRVADGTGIQLDDGLFAASVSDRERLGLEAFAGSANSANLAAAGPAPSAVADLFG